MKLYFPLIVIGAAIGVISILLVVAYSFVKSKKDAFGFERTISDKEILKRLLRYAKPYAGSFSLAFVLMLVSIVYEVVGPYIVGDVEELIKDEFALSDLIIRAVIYASIMVVSLASTYLQKLILQRTGQKIVSNIREDAFVHIESLSHGQLNEIPVGKLVTRVSNDAQHIARLFTNVLVNLFKDFFVIFGVLAAMLVLNYELTLVVLCFVPFIVFFTFMFRRFSRMTFRKEKECTTDLNAFLAENLSGIKLTQSFNRTQKKYEEFSVKSKAHGRAAMNTVFVFGVFRPIVYLLYVSTVLFLFYFGARGYLDGATLFGTAIGSGVIVSFYMYITTFFDPIQNLAEQFNVLQSALASAEKIFLICDVPPAVTDAPDAVEIENVRGEIEFRDVWFYYVKDEWVLKGVSFKINAGDTVAFVGATGSGKSTILSLLCRNYDIQKGQILLDGVDITKIKISSLRRHFGQMPQDVFLFSGTIRTNIALRDDYTDEEIMAACRYVNADRLVAKLPKGLDEEVMERSNNFSQGERQLISFARMILHRPEVMILDEATANIDTETEILIQNSLEKLMKVGTMLIVAHRLSTVQRSDNIIVISHGEMIEQGTHRELIAKKGKYYDLYTLQLKKENARKLSDS